MEQHFLNPSGLELKRSGVIRIDLKLYYHRYTGHHCDRPRETLTCLALWIILDSGTINDARVGRRKVAGEGLHEGRGRAGGGPAARKRNPRRASPLFLAHCVRLSS